MSKEITSKLTGKVQYVTDDEWKDIVARGWAKKFTMRAIPERKLPKIETLPPEVKVKAVNKEKDSPKQDKND